MSRPTVTRVIAAAAVASLAVLGTACAGEDEVTDPGQIEPTVEETTEDDAEPEDVTGNREDDDGGLY